MKFYLIRRKIKTISRSPKVVIKKVWRLFEPITSDSLYLKISFWLNVGYWPNFNYPKTFNEKLQWLKLYDKHPEYTKMVDKIDAKDYVKTIIGEKYIIPTIGIWKSVNDIDWDKLPNQFVIKAAHDSGGVVVCKDKSKLNIERAKDTLRGAGKKDYTKYNKEYPYYNVRHRFIAEQYMEDESGYELKDYKFFCFNGKVKCMKVDFGRFTEHRANYYDVNMNILNFGESHFPPNPNIKIPKPKNFDLMISIAEKLSNGIPFIRVDLYNIKGNIYFGELTFFPASGMGKFTSIEWDYKLGNYLQLPNKK